MTSPLEEEPKASSWSFDRTWAEDAGDWVPPQTDPTKVSPARIYDFLLGGKDNFEVDREAASHLLTASPHARQVAQANRRFLHYAVERMVRDLGIRQIIDLGTGIPTSPSVHENARRFAPSVRVLYVDHDPVVLAHGRAILATDPGTGALLRDLRDPASILDDPAARQVIDLTQPVGLLFVAVMHFVPFIQAPMLMETYRNAVPAGSCLAISAVCRDDSDTEALETAQQMYEKSSARLFARTKAQFEELFEGFEFVEPMSPITRWLSEDHDPADAAALAGGGRAGIGIKV
ncbi:MAG: hypothetical protein QG622_2241 [Actinomycetota bacterium]|nr:hypothetical protein [Actinomycetota bacterium]